MDVEPLLEVWDGTDQAQSPPAGLPVHDDDCPVLVELDVADVKACEFPDAGSRVPHEHEEGAIPLPLALVHQFLDIFAGDELVDGEVRLYPPLLDVNEQFLLFSWQQPAEVQLELGDVLVDRDGTEEFSPVDYVVFEGDVSDLFCILETVKFEKCIEFPHLGVDGFVFQLCEAQVAKIRFQVFPVDRVQELELVEIEHKASLSPRSR